MLLLSGGMCTGAFFEDVMAAPQLTERPERTAELIYSAARAQAHVLIER